MVGSLGRHVAWIGRDGRPLCDFFPCLFAFRGEREGTRALIVVTVGARELAIKCPSYCYIIIYFVLQYLDDRARVTSYQALSALPAWATGGRRESNSTEIHLYMYSWNVSVLSRVSFAIEGHFLPDRLLALFRHGKPTWSVSTAAKIVFVCVGGWGGGGQHRWRTTPGGVRTVSTNNLPQV